MPPPPLAPHPDRLLPADPATRAVARELYRAVRDLPILSPHGHVDAAVLAEDTPFRDPTSLFVTPDHYVTRLMHARGVALEDLGVGRGELDEQASREVWRTLCRHWGDYRGTPVRYWLESQLAEVFDVTTAPSPESADALYDHVAERLAQDAYRPRALFERFGVSVLATTDDPCDDLAAHARLAADDTFAGRVVPTFRPDRYLEPAAPGWPADVARLGDVAGADTGSWAGWVAAMEDRRRWFRDHGATSADHNHLDAGTAPLEPAEAQHLYAAALRGRVMTLHPGVRRGHHGPTARALGPDTGHDLPVAVGFTDALRPLLERFGTHPGFHLVVFTLDETTSSREPAPLAGFYPSVYVGAPWWFLDAPDAARRAREAVTESAGLTKASGFVDDTRAFCSIPARHDMARRLDAGYLARLVVEHRLGMDEAVDAATDLVVGRPRETFKL